MQLRILYFLTIIMLIISCSEDDEMGPDCATEGPRISSVSTTGTPCGTSNGSMIIMVSGGRGQLMYSIDDGSSFQSNSTFTGLEPGPYAVTVRDELDCEDEDIAIVNSGTSLSQTVFPIMQVSCAKAECHVAGTGLPDFTMKSNIFASAAQMRINLQNRVMPPAGNELSDDDRQTILCWLNDGNPDN
jgi:hypothetical protein